MRTKNNITKNQRELKWLFWNKCIPRFLSTLNWKYLWSKEVVIAFSSDVSTLYLFLYVSTACRTQFLFWEKLILTSFGCFPPGGCGPGGSGPGGSGPGGSGPGGSGPGGGGSGGSWANTRPTPRITASEKRLFILGISSLLQQSHGKLLRYLITQYTSYKYSKNDGVDQYELILLQFSYRFKHFRDWLVSIRLKRNSISCCHVGSCFNNNSPSCLDVSPAVFARIWLKLKIFSPRSLVVTNIFFFFCNEEGTRVFHLWPRSTQSKGK